MLTNKTALRSERISLMAHAAPLAVVLLLAALMVEGFAIRAQAATITVGGECSLYYAILAADGNPDPESAHVCGPGSGVSDTIILNGSADLAHPSYVVGSLTIKSANGNCVTISKAAYLAVEPKANLTLLGVGMSGDGSHVRSMIDNKAGTLTIKGVNGPCLFSNNRPSNLPDTGGILFNYDNGQSTIDGATFDFSDARAEGGAIYVQSGKVNITSNSGFATTISSTTSDRGGAIWVEPGATLNIASNNFQIINNRAGSAGGAIYNNHGTVSIARGNGPLLNVSIAGNISRNGGALFIAGGNFSLSGAVISNNSASEKGGGAYIDDVHPASISQTYFRANSADQGSAIFKQAGELNIQTSTFAADNGGTNGTIVNGGSSRLNILNSTFRGASSNNLEGVLLNDGTVTIAFSTLAEAVLRNTTRNRNALTEENSIASDTFCAAVNDGTGNLVSGGGFCPGINAAPGLANALQRNGGPTATLAITSANSPAVGAIKYGDCSGARTAITTDQRGAARPSASGGACTIGAYEYNPTAVPPDTVPPGVPLN